MINFVELSRFIEIGCDCGQSCGFHHWRFAISKLFNLLEFPKRRDVVNLSLTMC